MDNKKNDTDTKELKLTSLDELKAQNAPKLVELTGFNGDGSFVCRLKQPSLLQMAMAGQIPNALLSTVSELYRAGLGSERIDMKKNAETLTLLAKQSLVEPTYEELTQAGLELTDQQMTEIYLFVNRGVKALKAFRG